MITDTTISVPERAEINRLAVGLVLGIARFEGEILRTSRLLGLTETAYGPLSSVVPPDDMVAAVPGRRTTQSLWGDDCPCDRLARPSPATGHLRFGHF